MKTTTTSTSATMTNYHTVDSMQWVQVSMQALRAKLEKNNKQGKA